MKIELHPSVHNFDPLSQDERAALKKSLRKYGCKTPVLIWKTGLGVNEKFWLVDGRHRFELCRELDIPFDIKIFDGAEAEAVALAVSLNDDRRHQTQEQKRARIERIALARREGKSQRAIAESENVSRAQVLRDIELTQVVPPGPPEAEKPPPRPEKVTGRDGKTYSATKEKKKKKKKEKAPPKYIREAAPDLAEHLQHLEECIRTHAPENLADDLIGHIHQFFRPGKPTLEEVQAYCADRAAAGNQKVDPEQWYDHYQSNGWKVGRSAMKDWKAAVRTWERSDYRKGKSKPEPFQGLKEFLAEAEAKERSK